VSAHCDSLVGSNAKIGQGSSSAQEDKAGVLILKEESDRIALIYLAGFQSTGTGQTPALVTESWQNDALASGRVPDVLLCLYLNDAIPRWGLQGYFKDVLALIVSVHDGMEPTHDKSRRWGLCL